MYYGVHYLLPLMWRDILDTRISRHSLAVFMLVVLLQFAIPVAWRWFSPNVTIANLILLLLVLRVMFRARPFLHSRGLSPEILSPNLRGNLRGQAPRTCGDDPGICGDRPREPAGTTPKPAGTGPANVYDSY